MLRRLAPSIIGGQLSLLPPPSSDVSTGPWGAIAGFAGTLVNLTRLPTCGIDLSGLTSLGKTTTQRLAVSVWSTPDVRRKGLFQSANITGNSVEPMAQGSSGTILALDEFALVPGKVVGVLLYTLASDT